MTTPLNTAPEVGDKALVYDHNTDGWLTTPLAIITVIHQGIHGWIVELDNHRMIEVRAMGNGKDFRELSPEERHGKHQGYSAGPL